MATLTFGEILQKLENKEPFSFSRFGDGEWNAIKGKPGHNCDRHTYFPDMGAALKAVLESKPTYFIGMQSLANRQNTGLAEFERLKAKNTWVDADVLHRASIKGKLQLFFEALSKCSAVCLVGNATLKGFRGWNFIEVPARNCWTERKRIRSDISAWVKRHAGQCPVVLYCAGMPTNVLVDNIFHEFGDTVTQIDCGAVFDPYVGVCSRSYHKTLKIPGK